MFTADLPSAVIEIPQNPVQRAPLACHPMPTICHVMSFSSLSSLYIHRFEFLLQRFDRG